MHGWDWSNLWELIIHSTSHSAWITVPKDTKVRSGAWPPVTHDRVYQRHKKEMRVSDEDCKRKPHSMKWGITRPQKGKQSTGSEKTWKWSWLASWILKNKQKFSKVEKGVLRETKNRSRSAEHTRKRSWKARGTRSGKDARGHVMKPRGPRHGRALRRDLVPNGDLLRGLKQWSNVVRYALQKDNSAATTAMPRNLNQRSFS